MYKLSRNKEEEIKETNFHKKRIAFMIINNEIMFLENSPYTHFEWATSIGLDTSNFSTITRGFILNNEIFFYYGNFDVNDKVILDAKKYTPIICKKYNLKNPSVFGGMVIGEIGTRWEPKVTIF